MNALLSIKPTYVDAIVKGHKQYEFRKSIFRKKQLETVYIYSTAPVKKIVASFRVGEIIEDHPIRLWDCLKEFAGLNHVEFFRYFEGRERGFAIEIVSLKLFKKPVNPRDFIPNFVPPQSFHYLNSDFLSTVPNHSKPHSKITSPASLFS